MTLSFRRAENGDTTAAQQAYRRIINHLAGTVDFPHWHTENHPTPEEVLVVHALGVVPDCLGQGIARFLMDATIKVAREKDCRAVRLDTYVENIPARNLYSRYGFTDLGCHTVNYEGTDLSQFHLFEYVL